MANQATEAPVPRGHGEHDRGARRLRPVRSILLPLLALVLVAPTALASSAPEDGPAHGEDAPGHVDGGPGRSGQAPGRTGEAPGLSKGATIAALDPRGLRPSIELTPLAPRPDDLSQSSVYLVNAWGGHFNPVFTQVAAALEDRHAGVHVQIVNKPSAYYIDDESFWNFLLSEADAFVYGAAPSSSTTHYTVRYSALLESRGLPGSSLVYDPLAGVAQSTAEALGVPVRWVSVPQPQSSITPQQMAEAVDAIIATLTGDLTEAEQQTGVFEPDPPGVVAVEGTHEEVHEFFHAQEWTDGQAIVPPTRELVDEMLTGTSHAPDTVISEDWGPEGWGVTVESVAINAVMAGARPEYLPVLLASVQAADEIEARGIDFGDWVRSTNSFAFMQVVNGPIAEEIGMNAGTQALAPGNRANAVIGRALQLFIRNLGGGIDGVNMQSTIGHAANYGLAFAENEEESPWDPYHVDRGFEADQSVLTMLTLWNNHVGNYMGASMQNVREMANAMAHFEYPIGMVALLGPDRARLLDNQGMSKDDVREFLYENATRPIGELRCCVGFWFVVQGQHPPEYATYPADQVVPVFPLQNIRTIVVGGSANPMMQGWNALTEVNILIDDWR